MVNYFVFSDAKLFRDYLKAIETFSDEPLFHMDAEELMTRTLDPSRVMAIELHLKKQAFDEYLCGSPLDFLLDLKSMLTDKKAPLSKPPEKHVRLHMNLNLPDPDNAKKTDYCMRLEGELTKEWTFEHTDLSESDTLPPALKFDNFEAEIELLVKAFKSIVADADPDAHSLTITTMPEGDVFFDQKGERKYHVPLKRGSPALLDAKATQQRSSKYGVTCLEQIVKCLEPLAEIINLKYTKNMPLQITARLAEPDSELKIWLAPRVEE